MSVDHERCNSPRRENYLNDSIDDFTDCIDFTNQYQKSCSIGEKDIESDSPSLDRDYCVGEQKKNESEKAGDDSKADKDGSGAMENMFEGNFEENNFEENFGENFEEDFDGRFEGSFEGGFERNFEGGFDRNFEGGFEQGFEQGFEGTFEDNFPSGMDSPRYSLSELETDARTMEPDVTITVGTTTLNEPLSQNDMEEKDGEAFEKHMDGSFESKGVKRKSAYGKKNYLKLPINKNKKKGSAFNYKSGKQTEQSSEPSQHEYLQSNILFKCYKCSLSNFTSLAELQIHQRNCIITSPEFQSIPESSSNSSPSNQSTGRMPRKVYLCSACGTYYENWDLFLHMKEVHKRHICLFCLGMFSQPNRLAQHLISKHNIVENNLFTTDDFYRLYTGSYYLLCCSCESVFSEQEGFYEHSCKAVPRDPGHCPLCGMEGTHHPTCRRFQIFTGRRGEVIPTKPALEKKFYNKKKKVQPNKNSQEDVPQVNNNQGEEETAVTVTKPPPSRGRGRGSPRGKARRSPRGSARRSPRRGARGSPRGAARGSPRGRARGSPRGGARGSPRGGRRTSSRSSVRDISPVRLAIDDLVSTKQFNEKMLQLYRPNRSLEKVTSSIQSIEESINRVVQNLGCSEDVQEERVVEDVEGSTIHDAGNVTPGSAGEDESKSDPEKSEDRKDEDPFSNKSKHISGHDAKGSRHSDKTEKEESSDHDSSDNEKLTIALDKTPEAAKDLDEKLEKDETLDKSEDTIISAGSDVPYMHLSLKEEDPDEKDLLKEMVRESSWNCVYCAHAKKIAVNGKQLILHILAEHRFVTCPEEASEEVKSGSAARIVERLKNNIVRLQECYFNTDTFDSENRSSWKPNEKLYECFQCLFATYLHKDLYSHNRKMHQKAVFLCIMCKSNFYNYSELLCHLCPGIYVPGAVINPDITFRCFLCNVDPLPSSFRLMVHLRSIHNSCDICFDQSSNQFQLSTHVWKHKISHMCYRCGIAYRNKPDITKHLFWKHGTESVVCRKCLQKKWPHVYHFCVPPNSFNCDECSSIFKSAVALKVHKRIHAKEFPHCCDKCEEKFISRKLLAKHMDIHEQEQARVEAVPPVEPEEEEEIAVDDAKQDYAELNGVESEEKQEKEKKSKKRKLLTDVFDLPPVNLSESDDSDQESMSYPKIMRQNSPEPEEESSLSNGFLNGKPQEEEPASPQIVDGVWNNFQNYMDRKEYPKTFRPASPFKTMPLSRIKAIMLSDHDYYIIPTPNQEDLKGDADKVEENANVDVGRDFCSNDNNNDNANSINNNENDNDSITRNNVDENSSSNSKIKMRSRDGSGSSSSSDSSSDSESSCSCGSKCSCSSSSSSSSSSSDSDSDSEESSSQSKGVFTDANLAGAETEQSQDVDISGHDTSNENPISESDLDTEETETDEDFYDYNPATEANKVLSAKRTQLVVKLNGSGGAIAKAPSTDAANPEVPKKKSGKKKKSRSRSRVTAKSRSSRKKNQKSPTDKEDAPESNAASSRQMKEIITNGTLETDPPASENVQSSNEGEGEGEGEGEREGEDRDEQEGTGEGEQGGMAEAGLAAMGEGEHIGMDEGGLEAMGVGENMGIDEAGLEAMGEGERVGMGIGEGVQVGMGECERERIGVGEGERVRMGENERLGMGEGEQGGMAEAGLAAMGEGEREVENRDGGERDEIGKLVMAEGEREKTGEGEGQVMGEREQQDKVEGERQITGEEEQQGETEGKRPKRKRIPQKFYGFSSDEESETPTVSRKREKAEHNTTTPAPEATPEPTTSAAKEPRTKKQKSPRRSRSGQGGSSQKKVNPMIMRPTPPFRQVEYFGGSVKSSDLLQVRRSEKNPGHGHGSGSGSRSGAAGRSASATAARKGEKLYCFCQCPYDEVSEMIACDAKNCVIEWFHFECVGIMVPPKGNWFCPDCRKNLAAVNEFLTPAS